MKTVALLLVATFALVMLADNAPAGVYGNRGRGSPVVVGNGYGYRSTYYASPVYGGYSYYVQPAVVVQQEYVAPVVQQQYVAPVVQQQYVAPVIAPVVVQPVYSYYSAPLVTYGYNYRGGGRTIVVVGRHR